jgi:hypothetical protein
VHRFGKIDTERKLNDHKRTFGIVWLPHKDGEYQLLRFTVDQLLHRTAIEFFPVTGAFHAPSSLRGCNHRAANGDQTCEGNR